MVKGIYRPEYETLTQLIRQMRANAGMTQSQCSEALGRPQSFMSDVENGSRRLDLVQIRDLCAVLGTDLPTFVRTYESLLAGSEQDR
ncbi:multiprotein-bridging factor 1 family protein [Pseudomonas sp. GCM10022186]|uniref:helix-turn-helix domain-containing protein n=1 Tax=unclassified Pseudomonas TaxID=196821 RepID=UPI0036199417